MDHVWIQKGAVSRSVPMHVKPIATTRLADFIERRSHQVSTKLHFHSTTILKASFHFQELNSDLSDDFHTHHLLDYGGLPYFFKMSYKLLSVQLTT